VTDTNGAPAQPVAELDARALAKRLRQYREPNLARSIFEIIVTVTPLVALWVAMWAAVHFGYVWLCFLLSVPAAGFIVRLFMIQHDCGHGAFFRSRAANDWVGRVASVVTLTPYDDWRRIHAIHHANSNNLDQRGIGDVTTLTVDEYLSRSAPRRFRYRLYRHPFVLFGIGAAYLFLLRQRVPAGSMRSEWLPWASVMVTNAGIALLAVTLAWTVGIGTLLIVQLPAMLLAASIGVWLIYVQHQFEETAWEWQPDWTLHETALHGSSHYDLPVVLRWFTANIGIHHVHHLCSRIPFYRLGQVLRDIPELRNVGRMTLRESLSTVRLALWDETERRLISFREVHARYGRELTSSPVAQPVPES
jgi:omega-6 fatty acid desaturase (delta-12 desaturase)